MVDSTGSEDAPPVVVAGVAEKARRVAAGDAGQVASARLPMRSGGWLRLHASLLDGDLGGRVAVIVAPAREAEIADLIVQVYGLSTREQEVTRLVLHGLSTREMSRRLSVSGYTVQDHLKAIFAKVGVDSRRELAARLFFQHYAPRLDEGAEVGADGWFSES
jgi:DNA-binding CsgD family transcriptional regulator